MLDVQAHPCKYIRVLPSTAATFSVAFYNSAPDNVAATHPVVAALLATCPQPRRGLYTVPAERLANAAGMPPGEVARQLSAVASKDELRFEVHHSPALAFQVCTLGLMHVGFSVETCILAIH